MLAHLKKLDPFTRNAILVFMGTAATSFFNLLYQLVCAHWFAPADFASLNALFSLCLIIATPLGTQQLAVARYTADFRARSQDAKVRSLLTTVLKGNAGCAAATFLLFYFLAPFLFSAFKIHAPGARLILALLLGVVWFVPVAVGGLQGLEVFGWFTAANLAGSLTKVGAALALLWMGLQVAGALGAFLASVIVGVIIALWILVKRGWLVLSVRHEAIDWKSFILYFFPIAVSILCFTSLVNMDMMAVKYFFPAQESGAYSLAQMVGKIALFLPSTLGVVVLPRASALSAQNKNTQALLAQSMAYGFGAAALFALIYNAAPSVVLKLLTGKAPADSILLGRLFTVSMLFFGIFSIAMNYFLSIRQFAFIRHLILITLAQCVSLSLFHATLLQVQAQLCIYSVLLAAPSLILVLGRGRAVPLEAVR